LLINRFAVFTSLSKALMKENKIVLLRPINRPDFFFLSLQFLPCHEIIPAKGFSLVRAKKAMELKTADGGAKAQSLHRKI